MSETWKLWEGQVVLGEFPLLQYVGGSECGAVFLTERREGEQTVRAAIKLVPAAGERDEPRLSRWREAAGLSHPHLIRIFESGRSEVDNIPLLYVVMECAEENLAQVLSDRALEPAEVRIMLEPVLDALAYLHAKGLVHGHIKPANIMASGEELKVSSDELCRAGESVEDPDRPSAYDPPEYARGVIPAAETVSPAGDVWSLGMALIETLTRSLPDARRSGQGDPLPSPALQEPFLSIVGHCLVSHPEGRWTVADILARLQNRTPLPVPQPRTPVRSAQPEKRQSPLPAKRPGYAIPLAVGFVLAAIFVGTKLFHHSSSAAQYSGGVVEQPAAPAAQKPEEHPILAPRPNKIENRKDSTRSAAIPTSLHDETASEVEAVAKTPLPRASSVRGEVVQQVMPEVLRSAAESIRGTVRVNIKVDVDRSGNVEDAELASPGASRYFARQALQAARSWRFMPPKAAGGSVLSTWNLRFEFTRTGTTVVPEQDIP